MFGVTRAIYQSLLFSIFVDLNLDINLNYIKALRGDVARIAVSRQSENLSFENAYGVGKFLRPAGINHIDLNRVFWLVYVLFQQ